MYQRYQNRATGTGSLFAMAASLGIAGEDATSSTERLPCTKCANCRLASWPPPFAWSASDPAGIPRQPKNRRFAGGLPSTLAQWAEGARLFGELGNFYRQVTTGSQPARAYFDQGMLIGALAKRYPSAQPLDPSTEGPILIAYAEAMKPVAARYPDDLDIQDDSAGLNRVKDVLAVVVLAAKARIALAEKKPDEAINVLRDAVAREDNLAYSEPADWFFPNRHLLGAVLLKSGKAADVEAVYRDDLGRHPNNGWSLFGLAQSLQMQGRSADANMIRQRFDSAWQNSDVKLTAPAF